MRETYVDFLSPGTFLDETTSKAIACGVSPSRAVKMAAEITERYGAKPYGFRFRTVLTAPDISDGEGGTLKVLGKTVEETGTYYIQGTLLRYDDIPDHSDKLRTLKANMRNTDWGIMCGTSNGYRHTGVFGEKDFIVDAEGNITHRGCDPEHVAYRKKVNDDVKRENEAFMASHG